ncbi:unnamed protein product [Musa banksii]
MEFRFSSASWDFKATVTGRTRASQLHRQLAPVMIKLRYPVMTQQGPRYRHRYFAFTVAQFIHQRSRQHAIFSLLCNVRTHDPSFLYIPRSELDLVAFSHSPVVSVFCSGRGIEIDKVYVSHNTFVHQLTVDIHFYNLRNIPYFMGVVRVGWLIRSIPEPYYDETIVRDEDNFWNDAESVHDEFVGRGRGVF